MDRDREDRSHRLTALDPMPGLASPNSNPTVQQMAHHRGVDTGHPVRDE
jgi:hypothetical protein